MHVRIGLCMGILLAWAMTIQGQSPPQRYTFTEPHMGTTFKVMVYAKDETTANKAASAAFARIVELDGIMSDYKASSELMRLCEKAGGDPVKVSDELFY